MDSRYFDAYQLIRKDPRDDEYHVRLGQEPEFRRCLFKAVRNFGIDKDQYRLTDRGLFTKFYDLLIEIAENHGTDLSEDQFNNEFRCKRGELFSDWLGTDPDTYTVVFPIMIRSRNFPDKVELYESKAEQIDNDQWDEFLYAAKESDDSNFDIFLDELPNDVQSDHPLDRREWTYLKVDIEGRDEFYPLFRVIDLVELRFAEINFFDQLWTASMPQPAGSGRVPYEKWSQLQRAPFYLIFKDGKYTTHRSVDYDYRRSVGIVHFSQADVDEISEIPTFDYDADKGTYEGYIVSALLAFQDGITERSVRQSFFSFWRGIEILSKTSNFGKMVDRGEFAVSYFHEGDRSFRPETREVIEEIVDVRHELVHEGLKTEVHQGHRDGAKILLDGLLYLYIQKYGEWEIDNMASFLKYGVEYQDKIQFVSSILNEFSE
jgi:hypothetical protein